MILEDTQRPGRLVTVSLVRKPVPQGDRGQKEPVSQLMLSTRTTMDGSYNFNAVPVGEYWVIGRSEGYVLPVADVAAEEDLQSPTKIMAGFPSVLVTAERPAEANVTLQHGGVVTGHLRFDDGAPIPGVSVALVPVGKYHPSSSKEMIILNQITYAQRFKTDDSGAFRISGVLAGRYQLAATLEVSGGPSYIGNRKFYSSSVGNEISMFIYPPGTLHKAASPAIEIKRSEEIADVDITVNLSSMHTVSGRVVSKEDQHALNSGTVRLVDSSDKDLEYHSILADDGSFQLPYVPEGTYELSVKGAADEAPPADPAQPWDRKTLQPYAEARVPTTVLNQDVTLPDVMLVPKKLTGKTPETVGGGDNDQKP